MVFGCYTPILVHVFPHAFMGQAHLLGLVSVSICAAMPIVA